MIKARFPLIGRIKQVLFKKKGASPFSSTQSWRRALPIARFLQLLLFLSVVIGGGVVWPRFMMWINQPITRVEVHSTLRYIHKSRVRSMLNPLIKSRFFQLDLQRVREVLLSQSWVKEVSLRKEWPDKLVVFLEEKEPVARWGDDSLITGDGDVFSLQNLED